MKIKDATSSASYCFRCGRHVKPHNRREYKGRMYGPTCVYKVVEDTQLELPLIFLCL